MNDELLQPLPEEVESELDKVLDKDDIDQNMSKTLEFIVGMLNQAVGRKGCGYLKDECYDIITPIAFFGKSCLVQDSSRKENIPCMAKIGKSIPIMLGR